MRDKIFYSACLGFLGGVLWRSFFDFDFYAALFIGLGFAFLILSFVISKRNLGIIISVFILAFSLGILRFHLADNSPPEIFQNQIGEKVSLPGIITEETVPKENSIELIVESNESGAETKILLFAQKDGDYKYGDKINFSGKLEKPANFFTDQEKEFDYVNYLKKDGIFFVMRRPKIEIVGRGAGSFIKSELFALRKKLAGSLNAAIPEPESLVMKALILGERASFSEPLRQAFVNTGLIHIVTISGYHVTLVAEWIMKILGFLPMPFAIASGIFAIFLYVIMTGGAQTAIRAGIMATLALLARLNNRIYDAGRALVFAGVIMVFINPRILAFDVSFELSFLATIAVIFFAPKVEKYFLWVKWKWLRDIFAITCAAYVFVLPFIIYKMGIWSLTTLPANFAVLPFIPATMILGFMVSFAGLVSNIVAFFFGKIAFALLYYELLVISLFSRLSFSALTIPNFPFALTVFIYAILFWYLFAYRKSNFRSDSSGTRRKFFLAEIIVPLSALLLTFVAAGFLYLRHYESDLIAKQNLQALLANTSAENPLGPFIPDQRNKSASCKIKSALPDHECTPGAVFQEATVEQICIRGYTQSVRSVSTKLRKEIYAEYGVPYPQRRGTYEVDHLIPLALGGSNDIANLWTEAAEPAPGFHEKDLVEVYLQQEVCAHRVALPAAQRQIATDWLAIYNNLTPEQIMALKKKYGSQ